MRRTIMLVTVAVTSIALLGFSASPALADHRHFDHDVFDDHDHDEGLFDGGGPICPGEDEEPEFILGTGFVCVDENDRDDFDHDFARFDRRDFDDHDF